MSIVNLAVNIVQYTNRFSRAFSLCCEEGEDKQARANTQTNGENQSHSEQQSQPQQHTQLYIFHLHSAIFDFSHRVGHNSYFKHHNRGVFQKSDRKIQETLHC